MCGHIPRGKLLSGEGYREPFGMMNLACEHKFDKRLSLNTRANHVLRNALQAAGVNPDSPPAQAQPATQP